MSSCPGSGPSSPEVIRAQHIVPLGNRQEAWQTEILLWPVGWQAVQDISIQFSSAEKVPTLQWETREPIRGCWRSGQAGRCSGQEKLYLKLTYKLTGDYGSWGTNQVTATNVLGFLLIALYKSFTVRLNTWIGWLTPGCLFSPVLFVGLLSPHLRIFRKDLSLCDTNMWIVCITAKEHETQNSVAFTMTS